MAVANNINSICEWGVRATVIPMLVGTCALIGIMAVGWRIRSASNHALASHQQMSRSTDQQVSLANTQAIRSVDHLRGIAAGESIGLDRANEIITDAVSLVSKCLIGLMCTYTAFALGRAWTADWPASRGLQTIISNDF